MYSVNPSLQEPSASYSHASVATDHKFALQGSGGQCLTIFSLNNSNPKGMELKCSLQKKWLYVHHSLSLVECNLT